MIGWGRSARSGGERLRGHWHRNFDRPFDGSEGERGFEGESCHWHLHLKDAVGCLGLREKTGHINEWNAIHSDCIVKISEPAAKLFHSTHFFYYSDRENWPDLAIMAVMVGAPLPTVLTPPDIPSLPRYP